MSARLEEIKNGASVRGVASAQAVHVISVDWIGDQAISVVYRDHNGSVAEAVLYRDDEHRLEVEQSGRAWSIRCRTRFRQSMAKCCRGSRFASSSLTIPAPARRSWPGC